MFQRSKETVILKVFPIFVE